MAATRKRRKFVLTTASAAAGAVPSDPVNTLLVLAESGGHTYLIGVV